jgi:alpha-galactosidase
MKIRSICFRILLSVLSWSVIMWAQDSTLAQTPPMGWNSWNHFACQVSDRVVRAQADVLVSSGMKSVGYLYILIDDCWQGTRDAAGYIRPNAKFTDMKSLADYVHGKGFKDWNLFFARPDNLWRLSRKLWP